MQTASFKILFMTALLIAIPALAQAHGGYTHGGGFFTGLLHPVLGLDHLLAMVGVGIVSAQIGGRAIWTVPTTFVVVMAVSGYLGIVMQDSVGIELALYAVEQGIILSVILLGIAIACAGRVSEAFAMICVAFFATFHGYAHGNEFPDFNIQWLYIVGFMLGTAGLHICGVLIGAVSERLPHGQTLLKHSGSVMLGMGIMIAIDYAQYALFW